LFLFVHNFASFYSKARWSSHDVAVLDAGLWSPSPSATESRAPIET
jgi:hypothetical protein